MVQAAATDEASRAGSGTGHTPHSEPCARRPHPRNGLSRWRPACRWKGGVGFGGHACGIQLLTRNEVKRAASDSLQLRCRASVPDTAVQAKAIHTYCDGRAESGAAVPAAETGERLPFCGAGLAVPAAGADDITSPVVAAGGPLRLSSMPISFSASASGTPSVPDTPPFPPTRWPGGKRPPRSGPRAGCNPLRQRAPGRPASP